MKCLISGFFPAVTCEEVSEADAKFEFIMLALRTRYGVSLAEYEKRFGKTFGEDFPVALQKSSRYLEREEDSIRIKEEYLYVQNSVLMPRSEEHTNSSHRR